MSSDFILFSLKTPMVVVGGTGIFPLGKRKKSRRQHRGLGSGCPVTLHTQLFGSPLQCFKLIKSLLMNILVLLSYNFRD